MKISQKREEQMQQLINDISEGIPLDRWKVKDFTDCINYQQDLLSETCAKIGIIRGKVIAGIAKIANEIA